MSYTIKSQLFQGFSIDDRLICCISPRCPHLNEDECSLHLNRIYKAQFSGRNLLAMPKVTGLCAQSILPTLISARNLRRLFMPTILNTPPVYIGMHSKAEVTHKDHPPTPCIPENITFI